MLWAEHEPALECAVTHAVACSWLAVGLWLLADAGRLRRVVPMALGGGGRRGLHAVALGLLVAGALPLVREQGTALALTSLLLLVMAALSVAVLCFPLRPRWYALSLPVALLLALATGPWS